MSVILRHTKEQFGQGPSKEKLQKEFFLMKQRKTESINQYAERVEHQFKQLQAFFPGRYDQSQLKEEDFSGYAPSLERFYEVPLYERRCWV